MSDAFLPQLCDEDRCRHADAAGVQGAALPRGRLTAQTAGRRAGVGAMVWDPAEPRRAGSVSPQLRAAWREGASLALLGAQRLTSRRLRQQA